MQESNLDIARMLKILHTAMKTKANQNLAEKNITGSQMDILVFIASEEAAIRVMEPEAENFYAPAGGEPVIVKVKEGAY